MEFRLKRRLLRYLDQIQNHYASYVSHICESIKKKPGVTVETLSTYLLLLPAFKYREDREQHKLLSGMRKKLEKVNSINKIFDLIGEECASFLNYNIFKSIADHYGIVEECEALRYPEHLEYYLKQHTLSEFATVIPPLEHSGDSSKQDLTFKFDIELTERVATIYDLKIHIANILDLEYLELLDIKEGCVIVTFLVPAHVAEVIMSREFTPKQIQQFRDLKVMWIESVGKHLLELKHSSSTAGKKSTTNEGTLFITSQYLSKFHSLFSY